MMRVGCRAPRTSSTVHTHTDRLVTNIIVIIINGRDKPAKWVYNLPALRGYDASGLSGASRQFHTHTDWLVTHPPTDTSTLSSHVKEAHSTPCRPT
jgi:hypothetical protein